MKKLLTVLIVLMLLLSACSNKIGEIKNGYTNFGNLKFPQFQLPKVGEEIVVITTSKGIIKAKLLEEAAPIAVQQFKEWVKHGQYENSSFCKIRKNRTIMIEKEEYNKNMTSEEISKYLEDVREIMNLGENYVLETNEEYLFFSGAIGFAHSGKKNDENMPEIPVGPFFIVTNEEETEEILDLMENLPKEYGFTKDHITAYREIGGVIEYNGNYVVFGQVFYGMDLVYKISNMTVDANNYPIEDPVVIEKIEIVEYKGK